MKKPTILTTESAVLMVWLLVGGCGDALGQAAPSTNAPPFQDSLDVPAYVAGEVLVKFKADVTDAQIAQAFRGASLRMVKQVQTRVMQQQGDIGITRARTGLPVEQAVAALQRLPGIAHAEPNWIYQHQATPLDPYFTDGSLWGMYGDEGNPANPYGSQAAEAWAADYVGSPQVVVGIIDEGMQIFHPDLEANIWANPLERNGTAGVDDDHNNYVDDLHGWDFYNDDNSVYDGSSDDHGTHVTGTTGAAANGVGVVGVNWSVAMISGKFLGPTGGTTDSAIEAVDYFTALKQRGVNIVALNNSWGGGGYSQFLHDAITRAAKVGILFVAAAGNGDRRGRAINLDSTPYYPACYDTSTGTATETAADYDAVIAVTAIDSFGNKASWANYGATQVDLGAPGVSIFSTIPDAYGLMSGTSMATPHVTGALALYASTHPAASASDIKNAILGATAPTASLSGKTVTGGRLDLSTVIAPPDPQEPPGDAPPTVAITAPANNATVSGLVTVSADAADDEDVDQVEFFLGETPIATGTDAEGDGEWSAEWDTSPLADGKYILTAKATDTEGQTTTSLGVSVIVDNVHDVSALIVPTGYEDVEGNNWDGTIMDPLRLQEVYTPQIMGVSGQVTICGMAFRLDESVTAVNGTIKILVRLSTTAAQPDKLSLRFSSNVGADVKQVFSGEVDVPVLADGFDVNIPFAERFTYDPGAGNLLVDITTYVALTDARVDAVDLPNDGTSRVFAMNPYATKAPYYDSEGDVIRFQVCPDP